MFCVVFVISLASTPVYSAGSVTGNGALPLASVGMAIGLIDERFNLYQL